MKTLQTMKLHNIVDGYGRKSYLKFQWITGSRTAHENENTGFWELTEKINPGFRVMVCEWDGHETDRLNSHGCCPHVCKVWAHGSHRNTVYEKSKLKTGLVFEKCLNGVSANLRDRPCHES